MMNCFCAHSSAILVFNSLIVHNSGNKHQNNPLVSAETVRHTSTYIILCLYWVMLQQGLPVIYTENKIVFSAPHPTNASITTVRLKWRYLHLAVPVLSCFASLSYMVLFF